MNSGSESSTSPVRVRGPEGAVRLLLWRRNDLWCWRTLPAFGTPKGILLLVDLGGEEPATEAALSLGMEVTQFARVERKQLVLVFIVGPVPAFPRWLHREAVYICNHPGLDFSSANMGVPLFIKVLNVPI